MRRRTEERREETRRAILARSRDPIRLRDVLTNDNYSNEQMIEIVDDELQDEKASKFNRNATKSERTSPTKTFEFKDWRGKISQPTLPEYRLFSSLLASRS